jgi:hypothetical protein
MEDDAAGISYANTDDEKLLRLSRSVGKDLRPLFHFWGVHPQNPAALAASIAAENIPASLEIRDLLLHYKTLVPANNAAYQSFMLNWWGKKPSVAGYWEETDHAMQWDETLDADGTNNPNVRPNGSIYVEASAAEIRDRVDELVDLYFPNDIAPNPLTFAEDPAVTDGTTITMTATSAGATIGPITYLFQNITTARDSGWISARSWSDTGLTAGITYGYRVKARDGIGNETGWSPTVSATIPGDTTPPVLVGIGDDRSGSPVLVGAPVTYTVTFDEELDAGTVTAGVFGNAGTAEITVGVPAQQAAGVFVFQVTPLNAGTLQLQIPAGSHLADLAGNPLDTTGPLQDDTVILVGNPPGHAYTQWAVGAPFDGDANGDGVPNGVAWLLGATAPAADATRLLPTLDTATAPGYLIFRHRRADAAMADPGVTIEVQYGTNLDAWHAAEPDAERIIVTELDDYYGPGIDQVEVKIAESLAPDGRLFARLRVALSMP